MNKILIFDLEGTMAHFRKFYTNSSSLSYSFPPRTVITGIVAGVLGYERDSYYDDFNTNSCRIGLSIRKPFRKIIQTVNYVRTKGLNELTGSGGHSQIPLEFLIPIDEVLVYRIYFKHENKDIYKNLSHRIKNDIFEYPPYFGISECIAKINFVDETEDIDIYNKEDFQISTVLLIDKIESIDFKPGYRYMKEDRVPIEFNSDRRIKRIGAYLYEQQCKPIYGIKFKENEVFKLTYKDKNTKVEEFIVFME